MGPEMGRDGGSDKHDNLRGHYPLSRNRHIKDTFSGLVGASWEGPMDELEYHAKLDELDHLLNDIEEPAEPARIWDLLAEVSYHDLRRCRREG